MAIAFTDIVNGCILFSLKGKNDMAYMTDEEAERLDELYTKNPPDLDLDRPGIFMRQKETPIFLDEFAVRYITNKAVATKHTPTEVVSDMIKRDMAAGE